MALRVVFMGTPDFAVPTLKAIVGQGTRSPPSIRGRRKPAGRGMAEQPSPVHAAARESRPAARHAARRSGFAAAETLFASHAADVAVVVAYGLILPKAILAAPRHGCLNLHASAPAALARRGADRARHHGRRCGNRR